LAKKRIIIPLLLVFAFSTAAIALAGTASDPLLTLSYFKDTYLPSVAAKTADRFGTAASPIVTSAENGAQTALIEKSARISKDTAAGKVGEAVLNALIASGRISVDGFRKVSFAMGEAISAPAGTSFYLDSGTVVSANGPLVNLSAGKETAAGSTLAAKSYYLIPENNSVVLNVNSSTAVLSLMGSYSSKPPYLPKHTALADALRLLGLFKGTNNGYELNREATRIEGIIMLIRLMGEEDEALDYAGIHPFKDVPVWAEKYVAYAYAKGYTKGMSATEFGSGRSITGVQYVTMMLRALGYDDAAGDFMWDKAFSKGIEVGLYTSQQVEKLSSELFRRDQVVEASCNALFIPLKGTNLRLIDHLLGKGVFSEEEMEKALERIASAD